jgi:hypothetical protein
MLELIAPHTTPWIGMPFVDRAPAINGIQSAQPWWQHPEFIGLCEDVAETVWQRQQQQSGSAMSVLALPETITN